MTMIPCNHIENNRINTTKSPVASIQEYSIGDKKYIVKSVFIGNQHIHTSLLNLAERKTVREMGLDMPTNTE